MKKPEIAEVLKGCGLKYLLIAIIFLASCDPSDPFPNDRKPNWADEVHAIQIKAKKAGILKCVKELVELNTHASMEGSFKVRKWTRAYEGCKK